MSEIDPVKFGELCATVKNISEKQDELTTTLKEHTTAINLKLETHDNEIGALKTDNAVKKGAVLGVLGGGAALGAVLPEGVRKVLETIGKALS
jgi:hypothetical protein